MCKFQRNANFAAATKDQNSLGDNGSSYVAADLAHYLDA